jgi:hypothetical protein
LLLGIPVCLIVDFLIVRAVWKQVAVPVKD